MGFVGREELRLAGRAGLEHHYDEALAGEPQTFLAVNDAIQRKVRLERLESGRAGFDLELAIHARIQAVCETVGGHPLDSEATRKYWVGHMYSWLRNTPPAHYYGHRPFMCPEVAGFMPTESVKDAIHFLREDAIAHAADAGVAKPYVSS